MPRDVDPEPPSPHGSGATLVRPASSGPNRTNGDARYRGAVDQQPPIAPEPIPVPTDIPRGDVTCVAERLVEPDTPTPILVTDTTDPIRSVGAARELVVEMARRGTSATHVHVGPSLVGEPALADLDTDIGAAVTPIETEVEVENTALTTGAVEKSAVAEALAHLEDRVDRVLLTGTGVGVDPRQRRLAELAGAVVASSDDGESGDALALEFAAQGFPMLAVLNDHPAEPSMAPRRGSRGRRIAAVVVVGLIAVGGWLLFQVLDEDDNTDVAGQQAESTPPPSGADASAPDEGSGAQPTGTASGGLSFLGDDLYAPPMLTVGPAIVVNGSVQSEQAASRVRSAAITLAGEVPIDDQLVVSTDAVAWNEVRITAMVDDLADDDGLTDTGELWMDAIVGLVREPDTEVILSGGLINQPEGLEALLTEAMREAGFAEVTVITVSPGDPLETVMAKVPGPDG